MAPHTLAEVGETQALALAAVEAVGLVDILGLAATVGFQLRHLQRKAVAPVLLVPVAEAVVVAGQGIVFHKGLQSLSFMVVEEAEGLESLALDQMGLAEAVMSQELTVGVADQAEQPEVP